MYPTLFPRPCPLVSKKGGKIEESSSAVLKGRKTGDNCLWWGERAARLCGDAKEKREGRYAVLTRDLGLPKKPIET